MEYSQLIGQKIISIYESKIDSYVINVLVDKNYKINKLILVDTEENYKLLFPKDIFCISDNILIKSTDKTIICNIEQTQNLFINKEVININGKSLGFIKDMHIENWHITSIITTTETFSPNNIISIGEVIIINDNTKYKKHNFKPQNRKIALTNNDQLVQIMPTTNLQNNKTNINSSQQISQNNKEEQPHYTKITHKNTLIGKTLFKDLIGYNNVILAKRNSIVTIELIQLAKRYNVLNTLIHSVV